MCVFFVSIIKEHVYISLYKGHHVSMYVMLSTTDNYSICEPKVKQVENQVKVQTLLSLVLCGQLYMTEVTAILVSIDSEWS